MNTSNAAVGVRTFTSEKSCEFSLGMIPSGVSPPIMVCVFPLPVCPYAKMVAGGPKTEEGRAVFVPLHGATADADGQMSGIRETFTGNLGRRPIVLFLCWNLCWCVEALSLL